MTSGPQGKSEIRALLQRHRHRPNKTLGQHFLADPNVVDRIVRVAAVGPGDRVVEVGAGTGTLTAALAATGAHVVAFEIDRHLEALLAEVVGGLDVDLRMEPASAESMAGLPGGSWLMVANLPYNVGTPLVLDLLQSDVRIVRYVVMVQAEVADRLAARPGTRSYGMPSVVAGLYADVRTLFAVRPQVFFPPPDVDSAVVEIVKRDTVAPEAPEAIRLASAAFGQRRKMLRSSLAGVIDDPITALGRAGIDPTARPETLPPEAFVALAAAVGAP